MPNYSRYQANKLILAKLAKIVEAMPTWRFNQILQNVDITIQNQDMFYDESVDTLARMEKNDIVHACEI